MTFSESFYFVVLNIIRLWSGSICVYIDRPHWFYFRHLNGCSMDMFNRPSLFITDAFNATYNQERRKNRDGQLLSMIDTQGSFVGISYLSNGSMPYSHCLKFLWLFRHCHWKLQSCIEFDKSSELVLCIFYPTPFHCLFLRKLSAFGKLVLAFSFSGAWPKSVKKTLILCCDKIPERINFW